MDDKRYLKLAIEQAKKSVKLGGFPAGSVVVKDKVIAKGVSLGFNLHDPTSHSDISSIRQACKKLKTVDLNGATLYAALQPCLMCFSVANWAGISKIVYGCRKTKEMINKSYYQGTTNINEINKQNTRQIKLVFIPDFEKEILNLIKKWEIKCST